MRAANNAGVILSTEQRHRAYICASAYIEAGTSTGMCAALYRALVLGQILPKGLIPHPDFLGAFPELLEHKPKRNYRGSSFWFNPGEKTPRLEILKAAITATTPNT